MELYFEMTTESGESRRFKVRDGTVIGRHGCDINIQDSKLSARHAKVEMREDGALWLLDLGSSNKIKTEKKKRVTELKLDSGVRFILGRSEFKVEGEPIFADSTQPEIIVESDTGAGKKALASAEGDEKTEVPVWVGKVGAIIDRALENATPIKKELTAFKQLLHMRITRGDQAGTEWTLGYGPRDVGSSVVDLHLEEPGLPGHCFHLVPHEQGILLVVEEKASQLFTLNGKAANRVFLSDRDVIEVGQTEIEISLEDA